MNFFISYTKTDAAWAQWIAWELEREGYDCIIQAWDFKPGSDFIQQMRAAAEKAEQTIAVFSPAYFSSEFANAELNAALADDPLGIESKLVPVRVAECKPSGLLRSRVYIDLVGKTEEVARRELLQGISASRLARSKPAGAVRFPSKPSFPSENTSTAASGIIQAIDTHVLSPLKHIESPLRVLFLASDAGAGLDLKGEFKRIKTVVSASKYPNSISLIPIFDVSVQDLFQSLNEHCPHVIHFSGSMDGGAVLLSSKDGGVKAVKESALVGLLRALRDNVRLVVLNACRSLNCAEALSETIDCTIGVNGDISDRSAIVFAEAFYRGLGFGRSIKDAFSQAYSAIEFEDESETNPRCLPELRCREGVEPEKVILVQPGPRTRKKTGQTQKGR